MDRSSSATSVLVTAHPRLVNETLARRAIERTGAAAQATDVVPFESPNIEPAGSAETDDGSFNPAAGVVSFVGPRKSADDGVTWWPTAVAVLALLAAAPAVVGKARRRAPTRE